MELQVLLNEYESLIKSAVSISAGEMRERRERKAWNIYRFLLRCGVDENELRKIEDKYNF